MKTLNYYKIKKFNKGFLVDTYVLETFKKLKKKYKTDHYTYETEKIDVSDIKKVTVPETLHSMPFYDFETFFINTDKEMKKKKKQELIDKFLYISGVILGSAEHINMAKDLEKKTIPELKKMLKNI